MSGLEELGTGVGTGEGADGLVDSSIGESCGEGVDGLEGVTVTSW